MGGHVVPGQCYNDYFSKGRRGGQTLMVIATLSYKAPTQGSEDMLPKKCSTARYWVIINTWEMDEVHETKKST